MTAANEWVLVNSPDEIPAFKNEEEEHEFWSTHAAGPGMMKYADEHPDPLLDELLPVRPRSISIRIDAEVYRRLRALAGLKGRRYQTLLKEFVTERLYEEEKREGIIGR